MALKQLETTVETIDGINFYITPFPAFKAANIMGELASVLAPLLAAFAPLVGDGDLMDVDVNRAADAMSGCTTLSGEKVESVMKKLLLGGHIAVELEDEDGNVTQQRLDMDTANEIFCADAQNMFILCFYVIRLNFNGFFQKLGNQSGKVKSAGQMTTKKKRQII